MEGDDMVTPSRNIAIPLGRVRQDEALDSFVISARTLGIDVNELKITRPSRVFPWLTRNREFLKVSWRKRKTVSIFGLFTLSWMQNGSGIFREHPVVRVLMPLEAEKIAEKMRGLPEVEDMGVLEDRTIDPILAVRVNGRWYEAFRWLESPHILPDDCPLIESEVRNEVSRFP
jgi:hypothetical protein